MHVLKRDLTVTPWRAAQVIPDTFTLPAGTEVRLIRDADGIRGDLWAVTDISAVIRASGNRHDAVHRYVFVEADEVVEALS